MKKIRKQDVLDYHEGERPGKIEVIPTKSYRSQRDLSLAYSPGVAEPCMEIHKNPENVYRYTAKGNLVAVISNGSAVLGLGNIGPEASKPVMEGKGLLFKIFADIDVFDIELDCKNVEDFVNTVKSIAPTFGGINLEDIKSPECFEIERRLRKELSIPVMHDDQHGTAIISAAALINALELAGKKIGDVQIVMNGAGAASISCAKLYLLLGASKKNIVMLDSQGVLNSKRKNLSAEKKEFISKTTGTNLTEAMEGADVFIGLSVGNVITPAMLLSMATNPIVFALANPDPEIDYPTAVETREDIIMATGRSDYPNQVNNVLGFPFIFRGALDVRASTINDEMKLAAVHALANLTKQPVPEMVNRTYGEGNLVFGREYIIPKPFDTRLIGHVAPAVARAAIKTKVAAKRISNWEQYEENLNIRMGHDNELIRGLTEAAKRNPQRVVFAEADHYKILKAAQTVKDEGIAKPILLGDLKKIKAYIREHKLDLENVPIIDPRSKQEEERRNGYGDLYFSQRKRRGHTLYESRKIMRERNYFGAMMVKQGEADALISGLTRKYSDTIRPALQIIGTDDECKSVAGMYIMVTKRGPFFFADTTINVNPSVEDLVHIAVLTARAVKQFNIQPRVALLSYSNFGSSEGNSPKKVREAVAILHRDYPGMMVDGEVQANFALNKQMMNDQFPFSELLPHRANTLIFPNLDSGNIAYKILMEIGGAEAIGPVLLGMRKSVHILQLGSSVREIINMVTIAAVSAQAKKRLKASQKVGSLQ